MFAAVAGAGAIKAYAEAGGEFTDQKDAWGRTVAMLAQQTGLDAKKAYEDALTVQKEAAAAQQQQTGMTAERPAPPPATPNAPGPS
jgi:hypothetical protein